MREGDNVHLEKWSTKVDPVYKSNDHYKSLLEEHVAKLSAMRRLHHASNRHAILLILQATDAAGKDGAIRLRSLFAPAGSEPSPQKARTAKPGDEIGALTQEVPDEAGAVILEHQEKRPLIDAEVERRYP